MSLEMLLVSSLETITVQTIKALECQTSLLMLKGCRVLFINQSSAWLLQVDCIQLSFAKMGLATLQSTKHATVVIAVTESTMVLKSIHASSVGGSET